MNVRKPPSIGNKVVISMRELLPHHMTNDQMQTPSKRPNGPAEVSGPPMETNRPAPTAPLMASS